MDRARGRRFGLGGVLLLAGVATAAGFGCGSGYTGPDRVAMYGTVQHGGVPLDNASLTLLPAAGVSGPAAGTEVINGSYAFDGETGPVTGKYRAVFSLNLGPPKRGEKAVSGPTRWELEVEIPAADEFQKDFLLE